MYSQRSVFASSASLLFVVQHQLYVKNKLVNDIIAGFVVPSFDITINNNNNSSIQHPKIYLYLFFFFLLFSEEIEFSQEKSEENKGEEEGKQ